MRLLVRMTMPFALYDGAEVFETVVRRLRRASSDPHDDRVIEVDIDLPPKYVQFAASRLWNPDGTYRVEALVKHNRRSLADFLASGDLEWEV